MKRLLARGIHRILKPLGVRVCRISDVPAALPDAADATHAFDHTFARINALKHQGFAPTAVLDVGASDGRWTRQCLEIFPDARYCCVEPMPEHQPCLARLCGERGNVDFWLGCVGAASGVVTLNVDGAGTSVLKGHWGNTYGAAYESRVETIDNLVAQGICGQPDLIKLDVQGYELEVLRGAVATLRQTQCVIAETSFHAFQSGMPVVHEVVAWMGDRGFVVADLLSLSLRPLDGSPGQADILFLRREHPLWRDNRWDANSTY